MNKAVLISINPKWCELIASGKKTVEVRKTKPKLETPFKVYIYCTYGEGLIEANDEILPNHLIGQKVSKGKTWGNCCNGKVIGEFVCDKIYDITPHFDTPTFPNQYICGWEYGEERACLSFEELTSYLDGKQGYGWHISDLVIYDKPRELSEFWKADKCPYASNDGCTYKYHCFRAGQTKRCGETFSRPPQSWCYVEEWRADNATY